MGPAGEYVRALGELVAPVIVRVRQTAPGVLRVRVSGDANEAPHAIELVQRMLGTGRQTPVFDRGAAQIPWLCELAARMRGVRAPRYPSLWEACANAIVFQQISLYAATAILRRTIIALGEPVRSDGIELYRFPDEATLLAANDETLRVAGLSSAKIATLRRVAQALLSGALSEAMLEQRPSAAAVALLSGIKGIGPWTATVILLRGLGRLDVFPAKDSGVVRSLTALAGGPVDIPATLQMLGSERGMLYYHLLLARLEASGRLRDCSRYASGGMSVDVDDCTRMT